MLRFQLIDNVQTAFTANNLVVWTDFLDTGTHFHADHATFRNDSLLLIIYKCTNTLTTLSFCDR